MRIIKSDEGAEGKQRNSHNSSDNIVRPSILFFLFFFFCMVLAGDKDAPFISLPRAWRGTTPLG